MSSLIQMELLKLRKRPMTWIILALMLGFLTLGFTIEAIDANGEPASIKADRLESVTLPGLIPDGLQIIYFIGTIMLAVLAAGTMGGEYGWGTLRPLLATGVPRGRVILAKVVTLAMVATIFTLASLLTASVLGLGVALFADQDLFRGSADAAFFGDMAVMIARTIFLLFAPMLVAFFFAVLARSQAVGIGAALGMVMAEGVLVLLLDRLGDWGERISDLLMGVNGNALVEYSTFDTADVDLSQPRTIVTLAVYGAVALMGSLILFRRRDVRGAA